MSHTLFETSRLYFRQFTLEDAPFVLPLVNSPKWLKFIGDKQVHSLSDAEDYLSSGPLSSYAKHGFGLWLVLDKSNHTPIGMCGILKRDTLSHPDIGFALLPEYIGRGFGYEMAQSTLMYAQQTLNIKHILAITDPENRASIAVLRKIGMQFESRLNAQDESPMLLFSLPNTQKDQQEIDNITAVFFDLFTNTTGKKPQVHRIRELFIPEGTLISNVHGEPQFYSLEAFIQPREQMLSDGTLQDFKEQELSSSTEIYKHVAQRFSLYEKSGKLNGTPFSNTGMKTLQFIQIKGQWKLSSVAWSDEH